MRDMTGCINEARNIRRPYIYVTIFKMEKNINRLKQK